MNLLTLRNITRRRVQGIESTTWLANSAIYNSLNQGYYQIATKLANINEDFFEEQKAKFNLALNSALYALPADFIKFKQLRLAYTAPTAESDYVIATTYDPTQVSNVSADEINTPASNPIVDITNNYFRIYPKPTSAVTNGAELYYIARPSALTLTGDTPTFPTEYHDLLSVYASYDLSASFNLWDKYKVYKGEWEEGVKNLTRDLSVRNLNGQRRVRHITETGIRKPRTELWS